MLTKIATFKQAVIAEGVRIERAAFVYYSPEMGEYVIQFHVNGIHCPEADAFTDGRDAVHLRRAFILARGYVFPNSPVPVSMVMA